MADKATPIVNVSEVDAKKRKNRDVGEEMKAQAAEEAALQEKIAEKEAEALEELNKWMDEDLRRDLKVSDQLGLHATPDPSYIPEFLYKRDGTRVRVIPVGKKARWVRAIGSSPRVAWRRMQGYRPLFFDDVCAGTDCDWQRFGAEGYILNGDCILMVIDERKWEVLQDRIQERKRLRSRDAEDTLVEMGERYNVPIYKEEDGRRRFA